MNRLIAILVILFAGASVALAGDCKRSRVVYSTYQAPTYYQPYQYTPYYYPTYAATVYVPKVVAVDVQSSYPDHYYSIDQPTQIIREIKSLLKQEREGNVAQQPEVVQPPVQPPQPIPQPQAQRHQVQQVQQIQAPVSGRAPLFLDRNRPSAYQNAELIALVQQKCMKCHDAEQKMPLLTPDGTKLLDLTKCAALDAYFRVNTGDMPKTSPPVDDKFMPLFAEWARQSK